MADGSVAGIRHAEIVNWTGQALSCPRTKFADLKEWPESKRPGVYFLVGQDEESGQDAVYVGEAEIVVDRLAQHLSGKEFWNECILFTSKDDLLTKAHVKYLESKLVAKAIAAGRYLIKNNATPQESALPRADRDAMDEFSQNIKTLLGVLGHRVLDPINNAKPVRAEPIPATSDPDVPEPEATTQRPSMFYLSVNGLSAKATRTADGIVVLAGSDATKDEIPSLPFGVKKLRQKLIDTGVLGLGVENYVFAKDYLFNSPSQAAATIAGYSINGRGHWKTAEGTAYATIEDAEAKAMLDELFKEPPSMNP